MEHCVQFTLLEHCCRLWCCCFWIIGHMNKKKNPSRCYLTTSSMHSRQSFRQVTVYHWPWSSAEGSPWIPFWRRLDKPATTAGQAPFWQILRGVEDTSAPQSWLMILRSFWVHHYAWIAVFFLPFTKTSHWIVFRSFLFCLCRRSKMLKTTKPTLDI